jgi:hypothetical protein
VKLPDDKLQPYRVYTEYSRLLCAYCVQCLCIRYTYSDYHPSSRTRSSSVSSGGNRARRLVWETPLHLRFGRLIHHPESSTAKFSGGVRKKSMKTEPLARCLCYVILSRRSVEPLKLRRAAVVHGWPRTLLSLGVVVAVVVQCPVLHLPSTSSLLVAASAV